MFFIFFFAEADSHLIERLDFSLDLLPQLAGGRGMLLTDEYLLLNRDQSLDRVTPCQKCKRPSYFGRLRSS